MCGITAIFGHIDGIEPNNIDHRGPDAYAEETLGHVRFAFNRLSINDVSQSGMQPFIRSNSMLICNGEIYNHTEFETGKEQSSSDCECLINMITKYGIHETCNLVKGVFAFAWTDGNRLLVARDPFGVRPLFWCKTDTGIVFSSEIKAINVGKVEIFPPGHFYDSHLDDFVCYHNIYWHMDHWITEGATFMIRKLFTEAVERRVKNTDREIGFLLSGGLDSSLVVSVASSILKKQITTFSIGQPDSPDILAARKVAESLGTNHHEILFDFDEGVRLIPEVIKSLETYDTTTIRASVPMWILIKWIKDHTDIRVLLSGEGSDEILGGYKYYKNAPSLEEFQSETIRRLRLIHQFDVLRADRCTAAHGLELRVPFLDRDFVDGVIRLDPAVKKTVLEKQVLRDAFESDLPSDIIKRPKDAFSDAVGYGWVDHVRMYATEQLNDQVFEMTKVRTDGHNVPLTKEEAWYRQIFWSLYGYDNDHLLKEIWRPKWTSVTDPSARKLN
jgi:asparagine synthase (glutamine-hydrolysing)